MEGIVLTGHAQERSARRNISASDIDFIVTNGHRVHRTGVIFCQLRSSSIPDSVPGNHRFRQLVGTTVVLCRCGRCVVTVYREARAFHRDTRKTKYNAQLRPCLECRACGRHSAHESQGRQATLAAQPR
ncbi:MAG: hypothetical protein BroJett033_4250 [Chloroflexota bacterium]|nr:MAG: hypothetical protein BroJett033_4250 [Chloroflexota bacterium]